MSESITFQFIVTVVVSAGVGTAIVEIIFKLFLDHLLKEMRYNHRIKNADRRGCSDELLELINPRHFKERLDLKNDIYNKDYSLSDRLETIGEKDFSQKLDNYSASYKHLADLTSMLFKFPIPAETKEIEKDFLETHQKIDESRKGLLEIAKNLRK